jgi:hypothetical protein
MLHKFVIMISFIIDVTNYKHRRVGKRFFASIINDSLLNILLMNISSLYYFTIILAKFFC